MVEGVAEDKISANRVKRQNGDHAIVAALREDKLCNSNPMQLDLSALEKALASLARALLRSHGVPADEELRDACIQRFEYSFELA